MLLNILHMPGVCAHLSNFILDKILAIIKGEKDFIIYLETLLLAVPKDSKAHSDLRQQVACSIMDHVSSIDINKKLKSIITFIKNCGMWYPAEIFLSKGFFNKNFLNQLDDIQLAELLGILTEGESK